MFYKYRRAIARHLVNYKGWRTNRKIVVIESDDWGSIRMPSKEAYNNLITAGIPVDNCVYTRFDSLENGNDLENLFDILSKFEDKHGNHPIITANTTVANPEFRKIRDSNFLKYYYEPFFETLKRLPNHKNTIELWRIGLKKKYLHPQFHGREHLNIDLWLRLLQQNNKGFLYAFDLGCFGLGPSIIETGKINIHASFDTQNVDELINQEKIINEGLKVFKELFGFNSKSFIANNYVWHTQLNRVLANNGVEVLQGMKYQKMPMLDKKKRKYIRHHTGKINKYGQVHLIRNCVFEPTIYPNRDSVVECLAQIKNAFLWNRPAIISSHRLNYIGSIVPANRDKNLVLLHQLLSQVLTKWPDAEFLTSDALGKDILKDKFNQKLSV